MIVYHAGTEIIKHPLVGIGRDKLDFGKGFYVTNILGQAKTWAERMSSYRGKEPVINKYELNLEIISAKYRHKKFERYNNEWLHFIINNRGGKDDWKAYDVAEGGVADDRVVDTVELFTGGYITEEQAINRLIHLTPNNQLCIINQQLADECLTFIGTVKL